MNKKTHNPPDTNERKNTTSLRTIIYKICMYACMYKIHICIGMYVCTIYYAFYIWPFLNEYPNQKILYPPDHQICLTCKSLQTQKTLHPSRVHSFEDIICFSLIIKCNVALACWKVQSTVVVTYPSANLGTSWFKNLIDM